MADDIDDKLIEMRNLLLDIEREALRVGISATKVKNQVNEIREIVRELNGKNNTIQKGKKNRV